MALEYNTLTEELVRELHLEQLSQDKREALLASMGEALLKRIFLETMEKIGDAGVAEYEALLDTGAKQEAIDAFFEQKIPGYDIFVRGIITRFKEEMLTAGTV